MEDFTASRLKSLLKSQGMTQKELAAKAGITEAAVSHYLKGDRVPRGAILLNIAKALGVSTDYLLNIAEPKNDSEDDIETSYRLFGAKRKTFDNGAKDKFFDFALAGEQMRHKRKLYSITGERYEQIKESVADMYEDLGYTEIPINVFELCHKLNIRLIRYSALSINCAEYSRRFSDDGFNLLNVNTMQYQVYYNDLMPQERITFTIMHEIGHIMLDHKIHGEKDEHEANFFAKTALAPLGLIYRLKLKNSSEIAETFGISFEFAENIVRHYNKSMIFPSICEKEVNSRLVDLFFKNYMEVAS